MSLHTTYPNNGNLVWKTCSFDTQIFNKKNPPQRGVGTPPCHTFPPLGRMTSLVWPRWQILATPLSLALLMVHKAHAPTQVDWSKRN